MKCLSNPFWNRLNYDSISTIQEVTIFQKLGYKRFDIDFRRGFSVPHRMLSVVMTYRREEVWILDTH